MSDGDTTPPPIEPTDTDRDAPVHECESPGTDRQACRIEWLVVVGALIVPLIVSAVVSRAMYGAAAPAEPYYQHPLPSSIYYLIGLIPPLVIVLYIAHLRGVSLRSLGFRIIPRTSDVGWGVLMCIALYAIDLGVYRILGEPAWTVLAEEYIAEWRDSGATRLGTWWLGIALTLASMIVVGAVEETLRVYVIVRTDAAWGGGIAFGAWASFFLFVMYHVYYGPTDLLCIAITGAMFTVYFLKRREAWGLVIAHALLDIVITVDWYLI